MNRILLAILVSLAALTNVNAADLWRPKGQPSFLDANGEPLADGKLCYYDAGTTDQKTVYQDVDEETPWTQPIELNSSGELTNPIFMPSGSFKEVLLDSDATTCDDGTTLYTSDLLPGALDLDSLDVEFAKPEMPVLSKATNYTVTEGDAGSLFDMDATSGSLTLTLPSASDVGQGVVYAARKTDNSSSTVVLAAVGAETVNGASTYVLNHQNDAVIIVSDGGSWLATAKGATTFHAEDITDATLTFGKLATSVYSTSGTLSENSDDKLPTQKAVKTYVDAAVSSGLKWKDPVRIATTANGTLATAFENGDTVDGTVLATGNRILLKNQTSGAENGIYTVNASGAPTRATDSDTEAEINGATAYVSAGSANIATTYTQSATIVTIGTTAQVWSLISAANTYTADGTTITLTGQSFAVTSAGIGTTQIATDGVAAAEIAAGAVGASELASASVDTTDMATSVVNGLRDIGEIIIWAGTSCPTFSREANGAAINRTTYATLFGVIAEKYGDGDNSTTFEIPDYRGVFLRGYDHGAGVDPNAATRTAQAVGGVTGDNVGSRQDSANLAHTHTATSNGAHTHDMDDYFAGDTESVQDGSNITIADDDTIDNVTSSSNGAHTHSVTASGDATDETEARPINQSVLFCIYTGV